MQVRALTLNVWNDAGDPRRVEVINHALQRLQPDLVSFQEVVHAPGAAQLDALLSGTGLTGRHQFDLDRSPRDGRRDGIAVATRWPHRVCEVTEHAVAVAVDVPGEGELLFVGVAASYELDDAAAREREALALAELDSRHRRVLPTVLAGDFNAVPEASSLRYLCGLQSLDGRSAHYHDAWAVAGRGPGWTWDAANPNAATEIEQIIRQPGHRRRIDYVLVGSWHAHPHAWAEVRSAALAFDEPADGVWPSDHFGVLVELDVMAARA